MPNQPKTPHRSIRIDDQMWETIKALAVSKNTNASDVIRESITTHFQSLKLVEPPTQPQP